MRLRPASIASHTARRGFTLVELSIVLVIIALLIGGILGGQELVQASSLQSVIKDAQDIRDSVQVFKEKYRDLPGDMLDASGYWSGCTDLSSNPCNGDGDGRIRGVSTAFVSERVRVWQHLALAGIAPGNYSGVITNPYQPGVNSYASPVDGFVFTLGWQNVFGINNNFIIFESASAFTYPFTGYPLRAVDAKFVDQKVDDGVAYTGRVLGVQSGLTGVRGCPDFTSSTPSDYNVNRPQKECSVWFNWIDSQISQ